MEIETGVAPGEAKHRSGEVSKVRKEVPAPKFVIGPGGVVESGGTYGKIMKDAKEARENAG